MWHQGKTNKGEKFSLFSKLHADVYNVKTFGFYRQYLSCVRRHTCKEMLQEYHQSEPRSICQGKQWVLLLLNMLGPAQRSTMPSLHVIKLVKFPPPDTVFLTPQSSFVDPTEEFFSAWRRKRFNRQPRDLIHLKEATDTGYNDVPPASVWLYCAILGAMF